jgi:asparagine synthase (glutamine-hydrolysing)
MNNIFVYCVPFGEGYYYDNHFVFAHRSLAILDLSDAGKQSMEYMNRYLITYNSEICNYIELRK